MTLHPLHLSHRHAIVSAWVIMAALLLIEACVACHFYVDQKDVAAAAIVVTTWCKDAIKTLVEKFLE